LRLILLRVWQRAFMVEDLAEITAVDPTRRHGTRDWRVSDILSAVRDRMR